MKFSLTQAIKTITVSALVLVPVIGQINSVSAAPKYTDRVIAQSAQSIPAPQLIGTDSNYLGAGISGGLTNSNVAGEQSRSGGVAVYCACL
jgi:hypothetical protein